MPNYLTHTCFEVPCPPEAADWAIAAITALQRENWGEYLSEEELELLQDPELELARSDCEESGASLVVERTAAGVWIGDDDGSVNMELATSLAQAILSKFKLTHTVQVEWANGCTKPMLGAFGGGAAIVTATGYEDFSTAQWLGIQMSERRKQTEGDE
jgi:hypothetical protein